MNKKVFISGSINIESLPMKIVSSLELMIKNNLKILVGDAGGIDSAIQNHFRNKEYFNVNIYTIYDKPRHQKSKNFLVNTISINENSNKERENQSKKDEAMTNDSDYSLVIWDGKSKGSYQNILRSIEQNKPVKVFLSYKDEFIPQDKVTQSEIQYIFNENNGYTSSELLEQIKSLGVEHFKNTREINKYLIENRIIHKKDDVYLPVKDNPEHFKTKIYKGKNTGVLFTNDFVGWLYEKLKTEPSYEEQSRLDF